MAARVVAQAIIQGTAVVGKAFFAAYQQALKNAKSPAGAAAMKSSGKSIMHVDEALSILNIPKGDLTKIVLATKYKGAYDRNDPDKGGSFYLRSKIYRANLALEEALNPKKVVNEEDKDKYDSCNDSDEKINKDESKKN